MNRAMAMSMNDSQTLPGQETGVTEYDKQTFGPAQREYYDTRQWSMTVPNAHAQEILLSPEPFNRKREPGTPAFLKPCISAPRLSALIKILHEIPVAREALLNADLLTPNYGRDSQWWDGEPIKQLRVVNVDQGYLGAQQQELLHEAQRLMAFLDSTERAYGSVEGLLRSQHRRHAEKEISFFLEDWRKATSESSPEEPLRAIFELRGVQRAPEESEDKFVTFECLELELKPGMSDNGLTLYDAIDELIWEGNDGMEVFLKDIGNVVTIRVSTWSTSANRIGIDIPATWYPDRYLESSTQQAKEYREQKGDFIKQRDELEAKREKLLSFKSIDASSLLASTITHLEQTSAYQSSAREAQQGSESMDTDSPVEPEKLLEQLRIMDERIVNKTRGELKNSTQND